MNDFDTKSWWNSQLAYGSTLGSGLFVYDSQNDQNNTLENTYDEIKLPNLRPVFYVVAGLIAIKLLKRS